MIDTIAFDGDDTLWHNESLFSMTQDRFRALLANHLADPADIDRRLLQAERENLRVYGYGIKGFVLSMIETAVDLTDGRIGGRDIQSLVEFGKAMLEHPVDLLDGVQEVVEGLSGRYRLLLVTKGDLFDQESKIARSGLAGRFDAIEIVSEKDPATYRRLLDRHGVDPARFVMVGNSVRSDILPVLAVGGHAVHVPYHVTWAHEVAEPPTKNYRRIDSLHGLPPLLAAW
ncbi:haloacid dehalogenase [Azospirillum argentinense]|uniref:Haloacid dehalogenase n=1 Tax=Azospirillum argentinense TaxID=2970906 RepID=A0A060DNX8_9PROT|nr:HAD family hydrolase [Azospirillum argentinense]AIB12823.1 haloacid dehalogenase [Azospirillum argentinense]EZQ09585.1 haloacid dehalogenase [Azospirillum argentinense]PNQ97588.1 haloacid dehalogenase [Azospirillum argentinense]